MSSQPSALHDLLRRGAVRWSHSVKTPPGAAPAWQLTELRGRVVELSGHGASALTTTAIGLVHAAQLDGEPVAWVRQAGVTFFPPDASACGVDLEALVVVVLPDVDAILRAADTLLRSGAFGVVILDFQDAAAIALGVQARLVGLAKQHEAVLVCLAHEGASALGSFASLRAECTRTRVEDGVFETRVHVQKDKRWGRLWQHTRVCDAALGLR